VFENGRLRLRRCDHSRKSEPRNFGSSWYLEDSITGRLLASLTGQIPSPFLITPLTSMQGEWMEGGCEPTERVCVQCSPCSRPAQAAGMHAQRNNWTRDVRHRRCGKRLHFRRHGDVNFQ
jgi:hypothetical protein